MAACSEIPLLGDGNQGILVDSSPYPHRLGVLERPTGPPSIRCLLQPLRYLISAAAHRTYPESHSQVRHEILDVHPVPVILLAQAKPFAPIKRLPRGYISFLRQTVIAILQRIHDRAPRPIAPVRVHARTKTHPQVVRRAMNNRRRQIQTFARQHGRPRQTV